MLVAQFQADKVKITGPKVDGGYSVVFECGEYMQKEIAELFKIPQQKVITVIVHID